jgi:vancomycin permeability regulator SanA
VSHKPLTRVQRREIDAFNTKRALQRISYLLLMGEQRELTYREARELKAALAQIRTPVELVGV